MNREELSQIYYLTREIGRYKQKLHELENKGQSGNLTSYNISGSGYISNPTEDIALKLSEYKTLIKETYLELIETQIAAEKFIAGLDDVQLRVIMQMRFVDMQGWYKIARAIGSYSASTPRMIVDRFFEEN